ncbi:MAG: Gfo/Idh/MocA family oxidoreductase [Candidatus Sumerlaeia bacterium]|nr:Gfo/Idh/MocA family oxidoreductase [Candidatus Sumerlaeia bacterium]
MKNRSSTRRSFLKTSAACVAAPTVLAASTLGRQGHTAPNDRIRMGIIGSGGRGCGLMKIAKNIDPAVEFIAVCDAYEPRQKNGLEIASGKAKAFDDHRRLLEMKEIDAVIIATPEHQHTPQLIDAVQAGKDVYVEKPMTHSIEEGLQAIKVVRSSKQIVQVGMQRRSAPMCIEAKKLVDEGILGDVTLVRAQWFWHVGPLAKEVKLQGKFNWEQFLGNAPKREFDPKRALQWNWYWDYSGGMVTGQGVHLLDLAQWFMGKGTPLSAVMEGGNYRVGGETPDVFSASYEYDGFTLSWILCYNNSFDNGWKVTFHGTKGTLVIGEPIFAEGETGYRVYKEYWRDVPNRTPTHKSEEGLPTEPHMSNWLDCLRTRKEPNAPVEVGHTSSAACHIAIAAYRNKAVAKLDKACTKLTV